MRVIEQRPRYVPSADEIPSGRCECGCGQETAIAITTFRKLRWFKGFPRPFVAGHHAHRALGKVRTTDQSRILSEREIGYWAALIDGEGNISIRGRSVRVTVGNTDEAVMEWMHQFGGGIYAHKEIPNRRPAFSWSIGHRHDVQWLLSQIADAMIIKRTRARDALALVDDLIVTHG